MDVPKELLDQALAVFRDHPLQVGAIFVVAALAGSRLQRWVDGGEIGKLKAGWDAEIREVKAAKDGEINVLRERLQLAHDKQEAATKQLDVLEPLTRNAQSEIAQLKVQVSRMDTPDRVKLLLPQLDKISNSSVAVTTSVHNLSAANLEVGAALSGSGESEEIWKKWLSGQKATKGSG
jgi:hypothetical protein